MILFSIHFGEHYDGHRTPTSSRSRHRIQLAVTAGIAVHLGGCGRIIKNANKRICVLLRLWMRVDNRPNNTTRALNIQPTCASHIICKFYYLRRGPRIKKETQLNFEICAIKNIKKISPVARTLRVDD